MTKNAKYLKSEGFWKVTTEGDCEGRSIKDLGTHFGFVDEIAFALADKSYYSLCFHAVEPLNIKKVTKTEVTIHFDIDSGTWDMSNSHRKAFFEKVLSDRDVLVQEANNYASVKLTLGKNNVQRIEIEKEMLKAQALAKLTPYEIELLGI